MYRKIFSVLLILALSGIAFAQEDLPFRRMDYFSWQEFRTIVPQIVNTVILPVGTQEGHGVAANGADALVPEKLASLVAPLANTLIAPVIPYGRTTSLAAYPGGFSISEATFRAYCLETVQGLAKAGFKNIIIFNGHGPNRAPLDQIASQVSSENNVRILVIDWWSYCAELTQEIWGDEQDGGHAGLNENAAVMATDSRFVRPDLYNKDMAVAIDRTYSAFPSSGSILLYSPGKGYPEFDQKKADLYLKRVAEELAELIIATRTRWDKAGL
jgi:creatinine amidohydrolase